MSRSHYEKTRTELLKELRKLGFKSPAKIFPKLGYDADWEGQLGDMTATAGEETELARRK
jgi:hypothetical protein